MRERLRIWRRRRKKRKWEWFLYREDADFLDPYAKLDELSFIINSNFYILIIYQPNHNHSTSFSPESSISICYGLAFAKCASKVCFSFPPFLSLLFTGLYSSDWEPFSPSTSFCSIFFSFLLFFDFFLFSFSISLSNPNSMWSFSFSISLYKLCSLLFS